MRRCEKCEDIIPQERLEVLPNTQTCVKCSDLPNVVGFMVATAAKGTALELHMLTTDDTEAIRQAERAHRRSR